MPQPTDTTTSDTEISGTEIFATAASDAMDIAAPENPLFRPEVMLSKQHQRLWGELTVPATPARWLLMALAVMILVLLYSIVRHGAYTRAEVATGFLKPSGPEVRVVAARPATVQSIAVQLGDEVVKGQSLLTLATSTHPEYDQQMLIELTQGIEQLDERLTLLRKKQKMETSYLQQDMLLQSAQLQWLAKERHAQQQRKALAEKQMQRGQGLAASGYISLQQQDDFERAVAEQSQFLASLQRNEEALRQQLLAVQFRLTGLSDQYLEERLNLQKERSRQRRDQLQYLQSRHQSLIAEVDGAVTALNVNHGHTVKAAQTLLVITPIDTNFEAVLFLPPKGSGFIDKNQKVQLRVSAFPHEQFGTISGRIIEHTRTVLMPGEITYPVDGSGPLYKIIVALDEQRIAGFRMRSGMDVKASIALESRAVWEWLAAPILRFRQRVAL